MSPPNIGATRGTHHQCLMLPQKSHLEREGKRERERERERERDNISTLFLVFYLQEHFLAPASHSSVQSWSKVPCWVDGVPRVHTK